MSEVPRAAVTVLIGFDRAGESSVCLPPVTRSRRPVDRRSHERMTEPDLPGDADQPVCLSRASILVEIDAQRLGRAPENRHVTDRIRRDQQQHPLRGHLERPHTAQEAFLDPAREPFRIGESEAARELVRTQAVREFEQGQRITVGLGDDPVSHLGVQSTGDHGGQQVAGVGLGEALDDHAGNPRELVQGDAGGEDQREGIRFGAPGDKGQGLQGFLVDPLCVIDETQERSFSRKIGQQA